MKHVFEDIASEATEMFEIAMTGAEDERKREDADPLIIGALLQYAEAARRLAVVSLGKTK